MVAKFHHSTAALRSDAECPQALLAFLDGQLVQTTIRHEPPQCVHRRGGKRKRGTTERDGAAAQTYNDGSPSYKKCSHSPTSRSRASGFDDVKWVTLARVDARMSFVGSANESIKAFIQDSSDHGEYAVRLLSFAMLDQDLNSCECKIVTEDGRILLDDQMRFDGGTKTLEVMRHAVAISQRKTMGVKSKMTMSKVSRSGPNSDQGTVRHAGVPLEVDMCLRILVPDSESPVSKKLLDACMPDTLSVKAEAWSPRDFYDNVHVPSREANPSPVTAYAGLRCTLLPFQSRAIDWLLDRERSVGEGSTMSSRSNDLPETCCQAIDGDGIPCFIDRFLGIITTNRQCAKQIESHVRGGILAEEMGLGKTVEMIALMHLHTQPETFALRMSPEALPRCRATLIITPPAILEQWKVEIEAIAPGMSVYIYEGMKVEGGNANHEELLQRCLRQDVVLTTFNILAKEIHYAESSQRDLRFHKRYERRLSPLTRLLWWRVVLDEAQMIESGVSNAAKVANLIPRQNAWCVSGTPVKKDYNDLFGLLLFLQYKPYSQLPKLWGRLVTEHKYVFKRLIGELALRHTKEQIRDEIQLPAQKRVVITVPFTQIEEQHYTTMFQEMAEDCGLDTKGAPLTEDWDPESQVVIDKMRIWLQRLRQTCLHPEVGTRNRRALGGKGPLRTVNEVLSVMIEQNQTAARSEENTLLRSQLRRGQILEHARRPEEALKVWLAAQKGVEAMVQECRRCLNDETQRSAGDQCTSPRPTSQDRDDTASRLGPHRMQLRAAMELQHMCVFFTANAYYQLKEKEEGRSSAEAVHEVKCPTESRDTVEQGAGKPEINTALHSEITDRPKSDVYRQLEQAETAAYDQAKRLRKELLLEAHKKADGPMARIKDQAKSFADIPVINATFKDHGGIESRALIEKARLLLFLIQDQSKVLAEWRNKTADLLMIPLVDEKETELMPESDDAGKEYEASTKQQDELYVYVDALRTLVSDRRDSMTGQHNLLIDHEMKVALRQAKDGEGPAPQLFRELMQIRQSFKPTKERGSIRGLVTELRELKTDLRGAVERSNNRAAAEMIIVNTILQKLQSISTEQLKVADALDREVELFKDTMNLRLEYYRQLQALSDSVAPYEDPMTDEVRSNVLSNKERHEEYLRDKMETLRSKGRYLLHLRDQATKNEGARICIICTDPIETGVLTSCGHTFCLECLRFWWSSHQTCPTCKKHLRKSDFHQITYKPAELMMEEEAAQSELGARKPIIADHTGLSSIYSGIHKPILSQIQNIDLKGSFGTKIDTIARHLLWIREHDSGAKSIIFSQYKEFLLVLGRALKQFKIGFSGIDAKDGIHKFKEDPGIECFFLHARAHSSGLNLVNATHVFLCEPLINTAIELQAIARVHRIGQHHKTTVWMYLVDGTVEKSIYEISVQRRLAHMGQLKDRTRAPAKTSAADLETDIEIANSLELEDTPLSNLLAKGSGGGEMVPQEDLWDCLFNHQPGQGRHTFGMAEREVTKHLGAEAAEARMSAVADPVAT